MCKFDGEAVKIVDLLALEQRLWKAVFLLIHWGDDGGNILMNTSDPNLGEKGQCLSTDRRRYRDLPSAPLTKTTPPLSADWCLRVPGLHPDPWPSIQAGPLTHHAIRCIPTGCWHSGHLQTLSLVLLLLLLLNLFFSHFFQCLLGYPLVLLAIFSAPAPPTLSICQWPLASLAEADCTQPARTRDSSAPGSSWKSSCLTKLQREYNPQC